MPQTCENWLSLVHIYVNYAYQIHEIYQVLPYSMDFKAPEELWNPLGQTVFSKYSFIWNKGPVNIRNDCQAKKKKTCTSHL